MFQNPTDIKTLFESVLINQTFQDIWAWSLFFVLGILFFFVGVVLPKKKNITEKRMVLFIELLTACIVVLILNSYPLLIPNHNMWSWFKDTPTQNAIMGAIHILCMLQAFILIINRIIYGKGEKAIAPALLERQFARTTS